MKNLQTIWLEPTDRPVTRVADATDTTANAQITLDDASAYSVVVAAHDPATLRALARCFDEAAVRLSATLDARAAREVNTAAGAA